MAASVALLGGCAHSEPGPTPPPQRASVAPTDAGIPRGWAPTQTRRDDLVVTEAGTVVEDVLIVGGSIVVKAPNVTIRRVRLQGGRITNANGSCSNGLVVEDSTLEPPPGERYADDTEGAIGVGGYTARRVKLWRRTEGFRSGGKSDGCGPVRIENSVVKIALPDGCPGDPHADGIQAYDGPKLTIRQVLVDFSEAACGTAPVFIPHDQGNTSVDIDGLLLIGGGYALRIGVPASVRRLQIADGSWTYGPVDVDCSLVSDWDAEVVAVGDDYRVRRSLGPLPCA